MSVFCFRQSYKQPTAASPSVTAACLSFFPVSSSSSFVILPVAAWWVLSLSRPLTSWCTDHWPGLPQPSRVSQGERSAGSSTPGEVAAVTTWWSGSHLSVRRSESASRFAGRWSKFPGGGVDKEHAGSSNRGSRRVESGK